MSLLITTSISEITTASEPNNRYIHKKEVPLLRYRNKGTPSKEGGDLLSRIALQYHRRGRA